VATSFKKILCGVEGNPSSTEAARQAIALAKVSDGDLRFTAVYTSFKLGPDYHKDTLEKSLEEAARMAGEAGVSASYEMREAKYAKDVLLPESKDHDLLVLGTHGHSRTSGILFGSTASEAAHKTEIPLLIAREAPGTTPFPKSIVLATDGTDGSWEPSRAAADVAATFDAEIRVVHVEDGKHPEAGGIVDEQVAEIESATGRAPELAKREGHAKKEIVETARQCDASLIVSGRRGVKGIKSLGSVSERVVSDAACSVLLVPGAAT
jgi:nucleotide-binding universal stress UspA family protein